MSSEAWMHSGEPEGSPLSSVNPCSFAQVTRLYRSPAPSTRLWTPPRACSTTAFATRFARATGDCFRAPFFRAPVFRPEDPRFDAPFFEAAPLRPRAPDDFLDAPLRADFRDDDFRAPDFRLLDLRPDDPPRLPADFRDDEPFRDDDFLPLFFRAPVLRDPPLREPPRDDFLLDAMNSLLVRWWCSDE